MTIDVRTNAATSTRAPLLLSASPGGNVPVHMIPREQIYFWSKPWQDFEASADRDIEAGDVSAFEDANAALQWLMQGPE